MLREVGFDVEVFERSETPLEGRGAGIVLHPASVRHLTDVAGVDVGDIGAPARVLRYEDRAGNVVHEEPCGYRFTSYFWLHQALLACFDRDRYHLGREVTALEQDASGVTVEVDPGAPQRCALLVFADGIHSTGRQLLLPEVKPLYAGYVGWRGTVSEAELSPATFDVLHEAITYFVTAGGHILAYPIPSLDGSLEPGRRLTNWVWYRNMRQGTELDELMTDVHGVRRSLSLAPGMVRRGALDELRTTARRTLPPALAEMVAKTRDPFVQVVVDLEVSRMAFGRVCLIGDAAFALRPHAAAGTAKAAEDAWKLGEALGSRGRDVVAALHDWEPAQLALGRRALARTRAAGRRSQFEGTWCPGDPLPFGLYEVGDSALPP